MTISLGVRMLALALALAPAAPADAGALADAAKANPIPLMIDHAGDADSARLPGRLNGATAATIKTTGRFTWDVGRGEIVNPVGELVASIAGDDLEAQMVRVQGVIDKWTALRALAPLAARRPLDTRLEPGDDVHHAGERVTLVVAGAEYPYLTLVNLAADGTVNFLYPIETAKTHDSPTIPPGAPYTLDLQVTPPFGADHFIAIASAAPLTALHADLRAIDGKSEAASILDMLDRHLTGEAWRIGLHAVFSAK